jgi:hypothetical protein
MTPRRSSLLPVLLLALSLLVSQHAAIAHALSHLPAQAAGTSTAQGEEDKGERPGHRCHECLAWSALDAPLAAPPCHLLPQSAPAYACVPLQAGIAAASARHFDSRAPPRSL